MQQRTQKKLMAVVAIVIIAGIIISFILPFAVLPNY